MIVEVSQPGRLPQVSTSLMAVEQRVLASWMEWVQVVLGFPNGYFADDLGFLYGFCCFRLIFGKEPCPVPRIISADRH